MRKKLILIGLGLISAIFLATGCGKDSTKSTAGDENDAGFILAKADIDSSMMEFEEDGGDGSGWLSDIPLTLDDSVSFDTLSFWHIYGCTLQVEHLTWVRVDSFRFSNAMGDYQERLNLLTDAFEHKLHRTYTFNNTSSQVTWQKTRHRDVKWDGFTDSILVHTGTIQRDYAGQTPNAAFSHTMSGVNDSVKFRTEDFLNGRPTYPIAGQFYGTTSHSRQSNNNTIQFSTDFTVTFYEDHYHVHLVSGNNFWDWDHYYDD